jgi:hypothetical protein
VILTALSLLMAAIVAVLLTTRPGGYKPRHASGASSRPISFHRPALPAAPVLSALEAPETSPYARTA